MFCPCTGAGTLASPAVLALCTLYGNAWLFQPLHGHARPRHDANGYATCKHGASKPSGSCSSAWLQQPPSVSAATHRCCPCTQLGFPPEFTSLSYRQAPRVIHLRSHVSCLPSSRSWLHSHTCHPTLISANQGLHSSPHTHQLPIITSHSSAHAHKTFMSLPLLLVTIMMHRRSRLSAG